MGLEKSVVKIIELLQDERPDRQIAAAVVLGELKVKDAAAIKALGQCLESVEPAVQHAALEALSMSKSARVAAMLVPLLDHPDAALRQGAETQLATQGKGAVTSLTRGLTDEAPPARRKAIISLLASHLSGKVTDRLLGMLGDNEVGDHLLWTLRDELERMPAADLAALRKRLLGLLKDKAWMDDPMAAARTVRLLGYEPSAKLVRTLLPYTRDQHPLPVRIAALAALRRPLGAARSTGEAFKALAAIAAGEPEPALARAALDTLQGLEPGEGGRASLTALAESRHAEARAYALKALGKAGGGKVSRRLLDHLAGDDPAARRAAVEALAAMDGAAKALIKELDRCADANHLISICRALRPHLDGLTPAQQKAMCGCAVTLLEGQEVDAGPLERLAAGRLPDAFVEALSARIKTHLKARRRAEALVLLERLDRMGRLDDRGRFNALVAGVTSLPSVKSLARADRAADPVLRHLSALVASGFPAAARLIKDKAVSPEALFFIGFNYSESQDELQQELGAELLEHLVEASPRSKLGRSARNKLRLTGLGE